jgi:hypothetical protein
LFLWSHPPYFSGLFPSFKMSGNEWSMQWLIKQDDNVTCCLKARMLERIDQARFPRNYRIGG